MKSYAAIAALISAVQAASLGNSAYNLVAGQPFTITWYGAEGGVTLDLRNGPSGDLKPLEGITTVPAAADGTGSYTWTVPSTFTGAGPYAIVITDSTGPNYSSQFEIQGAEVIGSTPTVTTPTASATTTATATVPTVTTTTSSASAALVPTTTSTSHTFEFQSSSSVPAHSSSVTFAQSSSTTLAKTTSASTSKTTSAPSTIPSPPDGESKASDMASPLALILLSVAAMFYIH